MACSRTSRATRGCFYVAIFASLVFALAGCSPAPDATSERIDVDDGQPESSLDGDGTTGRSAVLGQASTWGAGRAIESATTADGSMLVVASTLGVHVYESDGTTPFEVLGAELGQAATHLAVSPDTALVAVQRQRLDLIQIWDRATGLLIAEGSTSSGNLLSLEFLPDNGGLMVSSDASVTVRALDDGLPTATTLDTGPRLGPAIIGPGAAWIAVASSNEEAPTHIRYDTKNGSPIDRFVAPPTGDLTQLRISPDGEVAAALVTPVGARCGARLVLWDFNASGAAEVDLANQVSTIGFSGDSSRLFLAGGSGALDIIETSRAAIPAASFSRVGPALLTSSRPQTLHRPPRSRSLPIRG